jgi:hypothetical protein
MDTRVCLHLLVLLSLCFAHNARAQNTNAVVLSLPVNCRSDPPQLSFSSVFSRKLELGRVAETIPPKTRINVTGKRVYNTNDIWFQVLRPNGTICWIYGGTLSGIQNVRIDPNIQPPQAKANGLFKIFQIADAIKIIPSAQAQLTQLAPAPERTPTLSSMGFFVLACMAVAVFVVASICLKKWVFPNNDLYLFLSSFLIILILGVMNQDNVTKIIVSIGSRNSGA